MHELGFKYAKINGNKKALVERKDLVNKRKIFVHLNKKEMKDITLFTWTKPGLITTIQHPISGHHLTLQMLEKIPLNKGQRFVILHAGCKTGFLPGCELVFKTKHRWKRL